MQLESIEARCQEHLKESNDCWERSLTARKESQKAFQESSKNLKSAMSLIQDTLENQGCTNVRIEIIQDESSIQGFDIKCENDNGVQSKQLFIEEISNV